MNKWAKAKRKYFSLAKNILSFAASTKNLLASLRVKIVDTFIWVYKNYKQKTRNKQNQFYLLR